MEPSCDVTLRHCKPTKMTSSAMIMPTALFVALLGVFAAGASAQVPQLGAFQPSNFGTHLTAAQSEQFKERRRKQERAVVGQSFPRFLKAREVSGREVTIRDLLRGPAVVIQLTDDSEFSDAILAYLRNHGEMYAQSHHVQVAVVVSGHGGNEYVDMLSGLPNDIIALYVTDALTMDMYQDHVLGGPISPVTLFLDKNLVVVDRHLGTYGEPEETLTSTDAGK